MRQHLGIVSLQPIGGLVTNNPSTTVQEQADKQKQEAAIKEAMRQTQLEKEARKKAR
jgi:hypothetical protein